MRPGGSVCPLVRPLVCPSIGPSVRKAFLPRSLGGRGWRGEGAGSDVRGTGGGAGGTDGGWTHLTFGVTKLVSLLFFSKSFCLQLAKREPPTLYRMHSAH